MRIKKSPAGSYWGFTSIADSCFGFTWLIQAGVMRQRWKNSYHPTEAKNFLTIWIVSSNIVVYLAADVPHAVVHSPRSRMHWPSSGSSLFPTLLFFSIYITVTSNFFLGGDERLAINLRRTWLGKAWRSGRVGSKGRDSSQLLQLDAFYDRQVILWHYS